MHFPQFCSPANRPEGVHIFGDPATFSPVALLIME